MTTTTPAGWYADPENPAQQRYWDGNGWTEDRAPGAAPPPPALSPYAPQAASPYAPVPAGAYGAPVYGGQALPPVLADKQLGDLGARLLARIIDTFLFWITLGIIGIVNMVLMGREGERNGQSLGKQWLNIRVIKEDGTPVDAGFAFLRNGVIRVMLFGWAGLLFTAGILGFVDNLSPVWDDRKQALHDKMAKSYVVVA